MTIRFGLIGFHHSHVNAMIQGARDLPGIELVAIADHDPEVLRQQAEKLQVPAYQDFREMLRHERLDAVGICEVYDRRNAIAVECLRAGISVTGDKPFCLTPAHVQALAEAWRAGGATLHLLLDKRFAPQVWEIKRLVDQGALGEIVSVYSTGPHPLLHRVQRPDWFFRRDTYGGILTDLAIHDLDLVSWLSGSRITTVQGFTGLRRFLDRPEFEDHGEAVARTAGGATGLVHVDWLTPDASPYWGDYRVYVTGTLGYAEAHWFPEPELTVCTTSQPPRKVELTPNSGSFADFVTSLQTGKPGAVTGDHVIAASAVAVAAQESARTGASVAPQF